MATTHCQTLSHHIPSTHHHHPQPTRHCRRHRVPLSLPIWAKQGLLIIEHHTHVSPPTTAAMSRCIHIFTAPRRPLDATSPPSMSPYAMLPPLMNSNRHITTSNNRACHVTLPNDLTTPKCTPSHHISAEEQPHHITKAAPPLLEGCGHGNAANDPATPRHRPK